MKYTKAKDEAIDLLIEISRPGIVLALILLFVVVLTGDDVGVIYTFAAITTGLLARWSLCGVDDGCVGPLHLRLDYSGRHGAA